MVVVESKAKKISIHLGDGAGGFTAAATYPAGSQPVEVVVRDLNGDEIPDLIVADQTGSSVAFLAGVGAGSFAAPVFFAAGGTPTSLVVGDFDGDCLLDLLVGSQMGGQLSVLAGNGMGGFGPPQPVGASTKPVALETFDFSDDLRTDLAVFDAIANTVSILENTGPQVCKTFLIHRSTDAASARSAPVIATTTASPFDDQPGTLSQGGIYYYILEHAGGLDVQLSVNGNFTLDAVRVGFDDGDPLSAAVDPALSTVTAVMKNSGGGGKIATVNVWPRDADGTLIGRGCAISVDPSALQPAVLVGSIKDEGDGSYSFKVKSQSSGAAAVVVTVEGTVLWDQPVIVF
ncbi:MAG: FG-GAP repeat domain-containing protein, partial [Acidobacteriota bacterium]